MSSTPLSFTAACSQLGSVGYNLVHAALRPLFTDGRIRMVTIGLPVLFLSAKTGAVIWGIARSILRSMGNAWARRSKTPPAPPQTEVFRYIPHIPVRQEKAREPERAEGPTIERIPLPHEATKERNAAFAKLIKLIDDVIIVPWIIDNEKMLEMGKEVDPLFKAMIESPADLEKFLRSMALWQFGILWEKGEKLYVKGQLPPPPSLDTISKGIRALQLGDEVEPRLLELARPLEAEKPPEGRVEAFQRIAAQVGNGKGEKLAQLAIRLNGILRHEPKPEREVREDQAKALHRFAVGMNEVVAISFVHVSGIIHGVLRAVEKTSLKERESPPVEAVVAPPSSTPELTRRQQDVQGEVDALIGIVSRSLREKYSDPLYEKHRGTWKAVATRDLEGSSPTSQFLDGTIVDTALLEAPAAERLSTQQLSGVFFLHAMTIIEGKREFEGFIERIPKSLLVQIQPTLVGLIDKFLEMIGGLNLERTTVKIFEFARQLLDCCEAVKACDIKSVDMQRSYLREKVSSPAETPLAQALQRGGTESVRSGKLSTLAGTTKNIEEQGRAIIHKLGEGAHKNVQLYHTDPRQVERDWVDNRLTKIKHLIRANTTDYNSQWLLSLLERRGMGAQTGWIATLLSLKDKVQAFSPALASVFEILIGGVQAFIETKGIDAVQETIDEISSLGPLSKHIAKTIMKSFLDLSTDDEEWARKLPFLKQAYQFLSPKEKELIDAHLKFLYQEDKLAQRTRELQGGKEVREAQGYLGQEAEYQRALADFEKAYKELKKDPERNAEALRELERAYNDLKTNLGLAQFERVKGLVLFIAGEKLTPIFNFIGGGPVLQVIMTVIQEAFDLLRYKKAVKHLIFTGVDLLIKELEITSGMTKPTEADTFRAAKYSVEPPSLFEFAEAHNLHGSFMDQVATFTSNCNCSGASGWLAYLNYSLSSQVTGPLIWGKIKGQFNETARLTSTDVATKVSEEFFDFAKDPNGLSTVVVEALTEHVADPRPAPVVVD